MMLKSYRHRKCEEEAGPVGQEQLDKAERWG